MLRRFCALGPVKDRWVSLAASYGLIDDVVQARAVGIVDDFYLKLREHTSSPVHVERQQYVMPPIIRPQVQAEAPTEAELYTQRLTRENKLLLQRNRAIRDGLTYVEVEEAVGYEKKIAEKFNTAPLDPIIPVEHTVAAPPLSYPTPSVVGPSMYLFGSVGRGKTLLTKVFFESLPVEVRSKRMHFFEFMKLMHLQPDCTTTDVANALADSVDVLCLDEVALSDVQDASLFPSALEVLLKRNVAVIMTSNQHPQDLYSGGLNRHIFLPPLLTVLRQSCKIVSLDGDVDYRTRKSKSDGMTWVWSDSHSGEDEKNVYGEVEIPLSPTRSIYLKKIAEEKVMMDKSMLCSDVFGESDLAVLANTLASQKITLSIHLDEPFDSASILSSARRFGKLVEALYDAGAGLEVKSKFSVDEIFESVVCGASSGAFEERGVLGDTSGAAASLLAASAVDEAGKSIGRCISRLRECRHH